MRNMRIGICEDDRTQLAYLTAEINKYYHNNVNIETFESAEELLFKYPEALPFQCLILDIKMKSINGMELAKTIRERDKEIHIIFVTGDKDFVFEGYKVGAVRYILKPVKPAELIEAIEYVEKEYAEEKTEEYFVFHYCGELVKIQKSHIIYIEVKDHYITIRTDKGDYMYKNTMKGIIAELDDDSFVQVSRSVLIHLCRVEKLAKNSCHMDNGECIAVSRGSYKEVNRRFIRYLQET